MSREALQKKFRQISRERLTRLTNGLLELKSRPENASLFIELKRELHTLKGEAKMLGFKAINQLAHRLEALFPLLSSVGFDASDPSFVLAMDGLGLLEELVDEPPDINAPSVELFSESVASLLPSPKPSTSQQKRGKAASVPSPPPETSPSSRAPNSPRRTLSLNPMKAPRAEEQALERLVRITGEESVRVQLEELDQLTELSADLLINLNQLDHELEELKERMERWRQTLRQIWVARAELGDIELASAPALRRLVSTSMAQLKSLGVSLAETQLIPRRTRDAVFEHKISVEEIASRVRHARMVPLLTLLGSFPRSIHDIAQELEKQVEVRIVDNHVSLDKQVLDQIGEPLLHLVRNALDHGIESPAARKAQGKPAVGEITLAAHHSGAQVRVSVTDDGRGIDAFALVSKAHSPEEAKLLDEKGALFEAALEILFRQGFSTASAVSDISGRGVGLDVVKRKIEAVGGAVGVESEPGTGTTFTLDLPVSVSMLQVLVVEVNDANYGLPASHVKHALRLDRADLLSAGEGVAFFYEGVAVPVISANALLGQPHPLMEAQVPIVLLEFQGRALALAVDRIDHVLKILQRTIDPYLGTVQLISGTALLDSGSLALLLSVPGLYRAAARQGSRAMALESRDETSRLVFLVDDSEIAREVSGGILREAGYQTREAIDGEDALEQLQTFRPDLILSDLEMPRVDGFDLLRALRGAPATADLPVIVLSSRGSESDIRRALELGADAYLVKNQLQDQELLEAIARLL